MHARCTVHSPQCSSMLHIAVQCSAAKIFLYFSVMGRHHSAVRCSGVVDIFGPRVKQMALSEYVRIFTEVS